MSPAAIKALATTTAIKELENPEAAWAASTAANGRRAGALPERRSSIQTSSRAVTSTSSCAATRHRRHAPVFSSTAAGRSPHSTLNLLADA
jgi:hypothetical protein